jgi:catechol 2,3-dioxygenase-like lactoylglutathione lyase family enzyme
MLKSAQLVGFVPTTDITRASAFYKDVLGLEPDGINGHAAVFRSGAITLRVTTVAELTPHPFTTIGWEVENIAATTAELAAKGVEFKTFPGLCQGANGVWTTPTGEKVAWFADPDGNLLSVMEPTGN